MPVQAGLVSVYGYYRSDAMRRRLRVLFEGIPGVVRVEDHAGPTPAVLQLTL